jgi:hypothetical protein
MAVALRIAIDQLGMFVAIRPVADYLSEQFVEYYYKTFDENRAALAPLYVCASQSRTTQCEG